MKKLQIAWSCLRSEPNYRREAFERGLKAAGYRVQSSAPPMLASHAGDVLLVWNRYWQTDILAAHFERAGGTVLVAENGYLGMDRADRRIYALARHAHNGRGEWFPGGPERWEALKTRLGITLAPMVKRTGYVLVAPNRSFGMTGGVMPADWAEKRAAELRRGGETARVRLHPGNGVSEVPLESDLAGASRVEIWSSSVGVHALIAGIPVVCHAPWWICKGWEVDREVALRRLAWAQWTVEEIADGSAVRHLLFSGRKGEVPAGA